MRLYFDAWRELAKRKSENKKSPQEIRACDCACVGAGLLDNDQGRANHRDVAIHLAHE